MSFGFDSPQPMYVAPTPRPQYVSNPTPAPRRQTPPTPAPRPVERPREPEAVRVSLPGPDELGITIREAWELPPPGELGIDPR
jgi:hypothetical protein